MERWMEAARTTRRSRRSGGPAEDRAQPAEDRSRRTGGGSGPTTSIRNADGALTNETLRVRADIACVTYICTWAVTTIPKWYWHFLDQSDFKDAVESQIRKANKRFNNILAAA